ncbi:MerR family transcriptional regulator [Streptomyces yunnanensis]|uniref:DNA-binding transcriptional regulator, MerR family n=1 Tax=Streptomyces yunnanensis TaxID=156453 RepID=A0A9X8QTR0_9ACTN|nr:MerR family transcriptional regulator [Streptomyces yunnanensis]SHM04227.1 DNA-binding transcriptional regulator, MerR family [Streptomyces yunnanensis]
MEGECGAAPLGIGELARRAGVTVKTVRHYSDAGLLPETDRSAGGHRRYGPDALDRLHRIRDLRAVGMPLPAVAQALEGGSLEHALAAQLDAVGGQLTALRWREAALRALTAAPEERRPELLRLVGGLPQPPTSDALVRFWHRQLPRALPSAVRAAVVDAAVPAPPADPRPAQVVGYARLHALAMDRDGGLAARCRRVRAAAALPGETDPVVLYEGLGEAYALAGAALAAGRRPAAGDEVDSFVAAHARAYRRRDGVAFRAGLRAALVAGDDPRMRAYWRYAGEVAGGEVPSLGAAHDWLVAGLGAGAPTGAGETAEP